MTLSCTPNTRKPPPPHKHREQVVKFTNPDLCALTEQVVFTDPYFASPLNRYTPQLGPDVKALRADAAAKAAATALKALFATRAEALVHGDLHTGSIMVTDAHSVVIDPEFLFAGPLAFDPAKIIGELLIPFFASDGLGQQGEGGVGDRSGQRAWLLQTIVDVWEGFSSRCVVSVWVRGGGGWQCVGQLGGCRCRHQQYTLVAHRPTPTPTPTGFWRCGLRLPTAMRRVQPVT